MISARKGALLDREAEGQKKVIREYYNKMWNEWNFDLADKLLDPSIEFRGSLGTEVRGIPEFKAYMSSVRSSFPDFHNEVDALLSEGATVVARLTYTGTHLGRLFGIAPTGRMISYSGAAFFRFDEKKIAHGWVLGDLHGLLRQLGGETRGRD